MEEKGFALIQDTLTDQKGEVYHAYFLLNTDLKRNSEKLETWLRSIGREVKIKGKEDMFGPKFPHQSTAWMAVLTLVDSRGNEYAVALADGITVAADSPEMTETEYKMEGQTFPTSDQTISLVHVRPDFQGKGLCTLLMSFVFQQLKAHHFRAVFLYNDAQAVGERCYKKAAQPSFPHFQCLDRQKLKTKPNCRHMRFS